MKVDPRNLRPAELVRLLNSTPLGEVLRPHILYRHRDRAGFHIGDGRHVDLIRYAAWLIQERRRPKPARSEPDYEAMKESARARNARLSAIGRDIGEIPEVQHPRRKRKAQKGFEYFCKVYFPQVFHLPWSKDHLKAMARIEDGVMRGGLFAFAMPRGSGKTSLCETACIWAMLIGAREFVCLIGSDEGHAEDMLDSIKTELDGNDRLLEDFPEAVYPIRRLDGIANRCSGQLYRGERTHMVWTAREIVLPTIDGSTASGAIIRVAGLTGRIRGMKFKRPGGRSVRPSLVVLDDPQTDESARSASQCATRESVLAGAVLGLAGPKKKIAGVMPCTVIRPGDMADSILDREKHPQWQGERTKMVYTFPTNEKLWAEYAQIRAESFQNGGDGSEATEFYRKHRGEMDAGAVVAWAERYNEDELSALQHAMNLRLQDEAAFFAEYQNEPLPEDEGDEEQLTADEVAAKMNGYKRCLVPVGCDHLTAFIDVQQKVLFYVVAAWGSDFAGYVIDYGAYPDQKRAYFTLRDAQRTLARASPGAGLEGSIYAGLEALTGDLLGREWRRDDGTVMRVERCLVDANWGQSTDVVYQFCRQSAHAAVLLPSHGRYVGASSVPFAEYKRKPGERVGHHWRIPNTRGQRAIRHVLVDTNYWKSFVHARLQAAMGDKGCLSLFGRDSKRHRLFAEHITAEYCVRTEARNRTVDEWKLRAGHPENHWLDCLVGCAVAASVQGAVLFGTDAGRREKRKRIRLSELQRSTR
ncbi:MAG TPA: terminase gpA endonuclease subunit [Phycisphaerae bacterium]|nr:terminase gpA endonuclease subunit [Phycisphaerae bacterium]